jgi:hypothetical protein
MVGHRPNDRSTRRDRPAGPAVGKRPTATGTGAAAPIPITTTVRRSPRAARGQEAAPAGACDQARQQHDGEGDDAPGWTIRSIDATRPAA